MTRTCTQTHAEVTAHLLSWTVSMHNNTAGHGCTIVTPNTGSAHHDEYLPCAAAT
jgi:hypothetical protein